MCLLGDFSIASNNCMGSLPANTNCLISLVFTPSGPGVRAATLTLTDDAPGSPQVLNVYGTGGFVTNLSGTTSASVSAGQTAQFNLQVTPGAGFNGTVSFTCSGVAFVAACNVPGSIAISNGTTTPFVVTVSTTAASLAPLSIPLGSSRSSPPVLLIGVVLLAAVIASPASAVYKFQTSSGTTTILVTPTAVPTGSSKQLQLNPIQLALTVR